MTQPALLPHDEEQRIACLESFGILDTDPEQCFDDLTRLAASICDVPIALMSLVDPKRQWFKSTFGIDAKETCRDIAFCAHTLLENRPMIVEDATSDTRFQNNPLVTGEPGIRFYAGFPLTTPENFNLGTLCVIDRVARTLNEEQKSALELLARQVVAQMMLRKNALKLAERVLQSESFCVLAEHSSDAHLLINPEQGVVDCNPAAVKLFQFQSKSDLLAIHPTALAPEFQTDGQLSTDHYLAMIELARRNGSHRFEWSSCDLNGHEFQTRVTLQPVTLTDRKLMLMVVHDLTEQKRASDRMFEYQVRLEEAYAKLKEALETDQLTGVMTRNAIDERLLEEMDRASRFDRPLSVVMLDPDHFRKHISSFGHAEGDRVLSEVAAQIKSAVRPGDLVARYVGEQFVIVLPNTTGDQAMLVAETCRRAIVDHSWNQRPVTLSLGVATLNPHHDVPDSLVNDARCGMYESKSQGRNRVTRHSDSGVCQVGNG